jgi:TatD DNase family protein
MWFDAHCHLYFDDIEAGALKAAKDNGVERMVCVGTDVDSSAQSIEIAEANRGTVYSTIGLHPHDAKLGTDAIAALTEKESAKENSTVVAIGEAGLDYFYEHSPRNLQREAFAFQIDLAKRFDLSLVIHTRDAWDETFEILRKEGVPARTVVHCFTGSVQEARKALELGLYLSFSGITTFKKSIEVQEAARFCPMDRLTIETDSPFLSPVPMRGKPNGPANVAVIGAFISELKKLTVEEFSAAATANTETFFNLSSP